MFAIFALRLVSKSILTRQNTATVNTRDLCGMLSQALRVTSRQDKSGSNLPIIRLTRLYRWFGFCAGLALFFFCGLCFKRDGMFWLKKFHVSRPEAVSGCQMIL